MAEATQPIVELKGVSSQFALERVAHTTALPISLTDS